MSRKPTGWRMPAPLAERVWSRRRNQATMVDLAGGQEAADERMNAPYKARVPSYVWNKESFRYHWRVDGVTKKGNKDRKGSFHPIPPSERKLYEKHLARRREDRERKASGHRLKRR